MNTQPDNDWESRLDHDELRWVWEQLAEKEREEGVLFVDNYRAARIWKSSQMRRFDRIRRGGCCGSIDYIVKRWSPGKRRFDLYLIGFNFGH